MVEADLQVGLSSSRKRPDVRREIDDIGVGEPRRRLFHQRGIDAVAGAFLEVNELPGDVDRMQPAEAGYIAEAAQALAVTGRARDGPGAAAGQCRTAGDAARRHV